MILQTATSTKHGLWTNRRSMSLLFGKALSYNTNWKKFSFLSDCWFVNFSRYFNWK